MKEIVNNQHRYFEQGQSRSIPFRIEQLQKLKALLKDHESDIFEALQADFKKPAFESYGTELMILYKEIDHLVNNLASWSKPQKVNSSLFNFPSQSYIHPQPYGVSLVIGAWNYPVQLSLNPALGSMAAGNCTIIKPSEIASSTADLLGTVINSNFDSGYLKVVQGDADTTQALLDEPLDYIFFTGSTRVGKIIMKAAAEQLAPVTLELGGKSPAIVDHTADLELAATRIAWGKFINAGQTCVSPDYVYVHSGIQEEFCALLTQTITDFYGSDPQQSNDFARIINRDHYDRLTSYLVADKIITGGETADDELYIAPTMMNNISWDDDVMQEEIFGPILPIVSFNDIEEAASAIRSRSKPLALYLFSTDKDIRQQVIETIPFGGGCINDTVAHLANLDLPFGGVGQSGMGNYHGKASFDLFSHQKSIMKKGNWLDVALRYPPYDGNLKWLKKLTDFL